MDTTERTSVSGEALTNLSAHARLSLSPERAAEVGPMLDTVMGLIDQLDALDLAETPVATAFDARWD